MNQRADGAAPDQGVLAAGTSVPDQQGLSGAEASVQGPPAIRPLVQAEGLTRHFASSGGGLAWRKPPPIRAVESVDLTIQAGEVLGIVGESGCGKSTLGRLLLRLLDATAGRVLFDGQDLGQMGSDELRRFRRHFQMIFQDPVSSLNARMKIGRILAEPLQLHFGMSGDQASERAAELLQQVGLSQRDLQRYPRSFSGGQGQRIAIARALASEPQFIVADEPVSALDVSIQAEVINLLQALQQKLSLALLFISHDLSVVEVIADRVVVLYLGRVMEIARTDTLFSTPAHPYTAALLQSIPGAPVSTVAVSLSGEIPSPSSPPSGCVFRTRCPFAQAACAQQVPALRSVGAGHYKACSRDDIAL